MLSDWKEEKGETESASSLLAHSFSVAGNSGTSHLVVVQRAWWVGSRDRLVAPAVPLGGMCLH